VKNPRLDAIEENHPDHGMTNLYRLLVSAIKLATASQCCFASLDKESKKIRKKEQIVLNPPTQK
jgi:hypothetical protein